MPRAKHFAIFKSTLKKPKGTKKRGPGEPLPKSAKTLLSGVRSIIEQFNTQNLDTDHQTTLAKLAEQVEGLSEDGEEIETIANQLLDFMRVLKKANIEKDAAKEEAVKQRAEERRIATKIRNKEKRRQKRRKRQLENSTTSELVKATSQLQLEDDRTGQPQEALLNPFMSLAIRA